MARLQAGGVPFGTAVALGLGLGYVMPSNRPPRYNGAGFQGDRDAIAGDFQAAVRKASNSLKHG